MRKFLSGNEAFAEGVRLARPQVISAYPITPQTTVVEALASMVEDGSLACEYLHVESEHTALSAAIGRRALCETQLQTFADPAVLPVNPQQQVSGVTLSTEADTAGAYELLHSETDDKKADDTAPQDSAAQTAADGDVTIYYAEDGTPLTDDEGYYIDEDGCRRCCTAL